MLFYAEQCSSGTKEHTRTTKKERTLTHFNLSDPPVLSIRLTISILVYVMLNSRYNKAGERRCNARYNNIM